MSGRRTAGPIVVTSKVYPSGGALATVADAMTPPPPVRFSTMTGCPSTRESSCAMVRAAKSVVVPGGKATSIVIARDGHVCAAGDLRREDRDSGDGQAVVAGSISLCRIGTITSC